MQQAITTFGALRATWLLALWHTGIEAERGRFVPWLSVCMGAGVVAYFGLRAEPNAWAGIRIPPTLENREVWKRTHNPPFPKTSTKPIAMVERRCSLRVRRTTLTARASCSKKAPIRIGPTATETRC